MLFGTLGCVLLHHDAVVFGFQPRLSHIRDADDDDDDDDDENVVYFYLSR